MKKMLIIHHCGVIGGAGNSLIDFIENLDKNKYKITVYCKTSDSYDMFNILKSFDYLTVKDWGDYPRIFGFYSGNENFLLNPWNFISIYKIIKNSKLLKEIINYESPDIIVLNSMTLFWTGFFIDKKKYKTILFDRETFGKELLPIRNSIIYYALKNKFTKVVYLSNYDLNKVKGSNGIIITDKFKMQCPSKIDSKIDNNKTNILFLGGNSLIKGIDTAIKSLYYLPDNYNLIVAGATELVPKKYKNNWRIHYPLSDIYKLNKIHSFMVNNALDKRIDFVGVQKNIANLATKCSILIIPTIKQHQSRPFIEAGFLKIPVIISNMDCICDDINENNCLTFDSKNAKELADCIINLNSNNYLKKELIENNFNHMYKTHNYKNLKKEIDILMKEVTYEN